MTRGIIVYIGRDGGFCVSTEFNGDMHSYSNGLEIIEKYKERKLITKSDYIKFVTAFDRRHYRYGDEEFDWVYLPIECSSNANSYSPVGDYLWTINNLNGLTVMATGGSFGYTEDCGPFYYAADRTLDTSSRNNYGAKLLFIPTKNNIYTANIAKWTAKMEG